MAILNNLEFHLVQAAGPDDDPVNFERCEYTDELIKPFPEYPVSPSTTPSTAPTWPTVTTYVEVTPGAPFRCHQYYHKDLDFGSYYAISYNIKIDNEKTRRVLVWKPGFMGLDNPPTTTHWHSFLVKTNKSKSVQNGRVCTIEVEVRPWEFENPHRAFTNPDTDSELWGKNVGSHRFAKFVFKCVTADFLRLKNISGPLPAASEERPTDGSEEEIEVDVEAARTEVSRTNGRATSSRKRVPKSSSAPVASSSKRPRLTGERRHVSRLTESVRPQQLSDDESLQDGEPSLQRDTAIRMARADRRPDRATEVESIRAVSEQHNEVENATNDDNGSYGMQDDEDASLQQADEMQSQQPHRGAESVENGHRHTTSAPDQSKEQHPPHTSPRSDIQGRDELECKVIVLDDEEKPKIQVSFVDKQRGFVREQLGKLPSYLATDTELSSQVQERRRRIDDIAVTFQHLCEDFDDGFFPENDERGLIEETIDDLEAEMKAEQEKPANARIWDDRAASCVRALRRRLHHLIRNTQPT